MENSFRFGCFRPVTNHPDTVVDCASTVSVIEGKELFETVCPVSKFTGHRESPFKLLGKLTGAKADVLNSILQELPSIASDPRLTDEDRAQFIVARCSTGTPAEDAIMVERIMLDLDALGFSQSKVDAIQQNMQQIEFNHEDAETKD